LKNQEVLKRSFTIKRLKGLKRWLTWNLLRVKKQNTIQKNVNINGQVRFVIDAPTGVDTQKLTQYVESPEFRNALNKVLDDIEETGTKPISKR